MYHWVRVINHPGVGGGGWGWQSVAVSVSCSNGERQIPWCGPLQAAVDVHSFLV